MDNYKDNVKTETEAEAEADAKVDCELSDIINHSDNLIDYYIKKINEYNVTFDIRNWLLDATKLCKMCSINTINIRTTSSGLVVDNFTDDKMMLETAYESGEFNHCNNMNQTIKAIVDTLGIDGIQMLTIGAIVGNDFTSPSNFGYLVSANGTHDYKKLAPLYGFLKPLDRENNNKLIDSLLSLVSENPEYAAEIKRISFIAFKNAINVNFSIRANILYDSLR